MDRAPPDPGRHPPSEDPPPWACEPRVVAGAGRIRREALDDDAVFVVRHLQRSGHEAYLVGGCVRDLLLGLEPKDFDVATDATPSRIKRLFRSAFVIGRRFRLVHVRFPGNRVVETATFRADPGAAGRDPDRADGPIHDDNVFGTAAEDAWRRDFSVNALFYDPVADEVVDYVDGLSDLESRTIRSLGDPVVRLREDPVRMIRAVHFAARLGGSLEPSLAEAITACAPEIEKASRSRLYIELVKVLGRGCARPTLYELHGRRVLDGWLPELVAFLDRPIRWPDRPGGTHEAARAGEPADAPPSHLTWNLLGAADAWGLAAHGVPESLVLATLLGPWLLDSFERGPRRGPDVWSHVEEVFRPLALRMNVPRRTSWELREILGMQARLSRPPEPPRRTRALVHRPVFPEALVYFELELRARDRDLAPVERWRAIADEVWAEADGRRRGGEALEAGAAPEDRAAPAADADGGAPWTEDAGWVDEAPRCEPSPSSAPERDRRRRRRGARVREDAAAPFDAPDSESGRGAPAGDPAADVGREAPRPPAAPPPAPNPPSRSERPFGFGL